MTEKFDYEISGNPTPEEERAVIKALETMLRREELSRKQSAWKAAGRAEGVRSGILDFRNRAGAPGWIGAKWMPWAGKRHEGRHGRGDTK